MISKKQLKHLAKLARLGLSDEELLGLKQDLNAILDYVTQLKEADTSKIEPIAQITGLENVWRSDKPRKPKLSSQEEKQAESLIKLAPETKGRYIKVKRIIPS